MNAFWGRCALFIGIAAICQQGSLAQPAGPLGIQTTEESKELQLPVVSGVDEFKVLSTPELGQPFAPDQTGLLQGYEWKAPLKAASEFFSLQIVPKDSNAVVAATLLNRLAYGPTPDELERVAAIGTDAYIAEQLAPEAIEEELPIDEVILTEDWQYVTVTGTASSSTLYIYLSGVGDCYIDDLKLVSGSVPEAGMNRIRNGTFDVNLTSWIVSPNLTNSAVVPEAKVGTGALHLVSSDEGRSRSTSIYQENLGLTVGATYTLSYWYKPGTNSGSSLTVRLSGSGIVSSPGTLATRLELGSATLADLRAWHVLHAVESKKQLLEVLLQFFDNHFVTQHSKSEEYFDGLRLDDEDPIAANLEYRELQRWREALLNPECTFHELLKISAESPAMIIYLDSVKSKSSGSSVANENYARELLELFTFGVDNGYDQNDITLMSRAWTGWSVRLVDPGNVFNPFAPQSTTLRPGGTNVARVNNLLGTWAFAYKSHYHYKGPIVLFPDKQVPARFGEPYAGRGYELQLPVNNDPNGDEWQYVTATGTASSSTLYIYLSGPGDCYIDDLKLVRGAVPEEGANMIRNGTFDSSLGSWTISPNMANSSISFDTKKTGTGALHVVATSEGTSSGTSIRQSNLNLVPDEIYTLSYWFRPGADPLVDATIRLSYRGIESSPGGGTNRIQDGYEVLRHLADQPFTQEFMSVKLCRLFVHDDFYIGYDFTDPNLSEEGRLVRACMEAWENNMPKGQIRKVIEVIFESDLFRTQAASMQKVKTPFEFTVSALRTLRGRANDGTYTAATDGYSLYSPMNRMGRMRLFDRDDPDGYPESGAPWISAGTLAERLRFVQALLIPVGQSGRGDAGNSSADPVKLLKTKLPPSEWNNARAVAEFFSGIVFPAEGKANLAEYVSEAVNYLNQPSGISGDTAAVPFASLFHTGNGYNFRVRGMVAMLMTFQRFQEQ